MTTRQRRRARRRRKLADVEDAVCEEVVEPAGGDEVAGVGGLDVLGEHEDAHAGIVAA
jgi:hypothetical protein